MSHENRARLWAQFLDAAKRGTKKGGIRGYKVVLCKTAMTLSDKLVKCGYNYEDRYEEWNELIGKVFARTVREYFLFLHSGEMTDFSIEFADKSEGTSIGNICDVKFSGVRRRFYIKCHQRGPRPTSLSIANGYSSVNRPFIQEIFVYKLLSLIKVGGEVHFPLPITSSFKKVLYIATEEINFTTAKQLTAETANSSDMILVDFLEYFLRLEDFSTNGGNYGQSDEGEAVIVDFWITMKDDYVRNV